MRLNGSLQNSLPMHSKEERRCPVWESIGAWLLTRLLDIASLKSPTEVKHRSELLLAA